eukprot:GILK01012231.1.p1 GENE.GILK01012231.1~~GILK01012231.1.p1  ORF type:complete len:461 (+),score=65.80 GILK01012231.1:678-2060(+)
MDRQQQTSLDELQTYRRVQKKLIANLNAMRQKSTAREWKFSDDHPLRPFFNKIARPLYVRSASSYGWHNAVMDEPILLNGKYVGTVDEPNVAALLVGSRPSSFGRGDQTVMDESVRKGREIPAADLVVPAIEAKVLCEIQTHLFPGKMVKAVLHKMTLYTEGGHFQYHRDTCYSPDHQGTLLYVLGSEHEGGELKLKNRFEDKEETCDFGDGWIAFYTDVPHQLEPVTSGVRIALQYNLFIEDAEHTSLSPSPTPPSPPSSSSDAGNSSDDEQHSDFPLYEQYGALRYHYEVRRKARSKRIGQHSDEAIIQFCNAVPRYLQGSKRKGLGIPLFHSYRSDALGDLKNLKGADSAIVDAIQQAFASSDNNFTMDITPVIYSGSYRAKNEDDEYEDSYVTVVAPFTMPAHLEGAHVEVIPHNLFTPYKLLQEEEQTTGNEALGGKAQYTMSALLVVTMTEATK